MNKICRVKALCTVHNFEYDVYDSEEGGGGLLSCLFDMILIINVYT